MQAELRRASPRLRAPLLYSSIVVALFGAACATARSAGETTLSYLQGCPHYEEEVAFPSPCTQCEDARLAEANTERKPAEEAPAASETAKPAEKKEEEKKPIDEDKSEELERILRETRDRLEDAGIEMSRIDTGYRGQGVTLERLGNPPQELNFSIDGDVSFAHGSAALTPRARAVIAEMAAALKNFPNSKLRFGGHTDSTGSRALNFRLSERRAQAVRDEMVRAHGLDASRVIEVRGYADTQRIVPTLRAEPRNRRVEIRVIME